MNKAVFNTNSWRWLVFCIHWTVFAWFSRRPASSSLVSAFSRGIYSPQSLQVLLLNNLEQLIRQNNLNSSHQPQLFFFTLVHYRVSNRDTILEDRFVSLFTFYLISGSEIRPHLRGPEQALSSLTGSELLSIGLEPWSWKCLKSLQLMLLSQR